MTDSDSHDSLTILLDLAARHGFDATRLRAEARHAASAEEGEYLVIRRLVAGCDSPESLGCAAGSRWRITSLGTVGLAMLSSPTVRAALQALRDHAALIPGFAPPCWRRGEGGWRLEVDDAALPPDLRPFLRARSRAATWAIVHALTGGAMPPPNAQTALLRDEQLDAVLPDAHAPLHAAMLAQCRDALAEHERRRGIAGRVRERLAATPGEQPAMATMARDLCMSGRTLRRRLALEGTSYRQVCDEARRALAEALLASPRLPIQQIADRLGFAEPASFVHAFKRWNGLAPRAYRLAARDD